MGRRTWAVGDASFEGRLGETFCSQSACFSSLQASSEDLKLAAGRSPRAVAQAGSSLGGGIGRLCSGQRRAPDLPVSGAGCLEGRAGPLDALEAPSRMWTRQRPAPEGSGSPPAAEQEGPKGRRDGDK